MDTMHTCSSEVETPWAHNDSMHHLLMPSKANDLCMPVVHVKPSFLAVNVTPSFPDVHSHHPCQQCMSHLAMYRLHLITSGKAIKPLSNMDSLPTLP